MSVINEHNEFISTKQNNEIEEYLIRIIKRYFEVHEDYTRNEMEAIVQESFIRLKRWMLRHRNFIFSINGKTGHLQLNPTFFGIEPEIVEKNAAFNKDFGNEADTICEGNDIRLYNKREPLPHRHNISDVGGLSIVLRLLSQVDIRYVEGHNNLKALNTIYYDGTSDIIDLIMIEQAIDNKGTYIELFDKKALEGYIKHNEVMLQYDFFLGIISDKSEALDVETEPTESDISFEVRSYCDENLDIDAFLEPIKPYQNRELLNELNNIYSRIDRLLYTGKFDIGIPSECGIICFPSEDYIYYDNLLKVMKSDLNSVQRAMLNGSSIAYQTRTRHGYTVFDIFGTFNGIQVTSTFQNLGYAIQVLYNNELYYMYGNGDANGNNLVKDSNRATSTYEENFVHVDVSPYSCNDATIEIVYTIRNMSGRKLENISLGSCSDVFVGISDNRIIGEGDDLAPIRPIISKEDGSTKGIMMTSVDTEDANGNKLSFVCITEDFDISYGNFDYFLSDPDHEHYNSFMKPYGISHYVHPDMAYQDGTHVQSSGVYNGDSGFGYCKTFNLEADEIRRFTVTFSLATDGIFMPTEGSTIVGKHRHVSNSSYSGINSYTDNKNIHGTRIKLSLEYNDIDGNPHRTPLPFRHITDDKYELHIDGKYNKQTGAIDVDIDFFKHIPFLCDFPNPCVLNGRDVYLPVYSCAKGNNIGTSKILTEHGCDIPVLDASIDNALTSAMNDAFEDGDIVWLGNDYYIDGYCYFDEYVDHKIEDLESNEIADPIPYYNQRDPDPNTKPPCGGYVTVSFEHNAQSKIRGIDIVKQEQQHGFILHYKERYVNDYFRNMKIRYDIMGNKIGTYTEATG